MPSDMSPQPIVFQLIIPHRKSSIPIFLHYLNSGTAIGSIPTADFPSNDRSSQITHHTFPIPLFLHYAIPAPQSDMSPQPTYSYIISQKFHHHKSLITNYAPQITNSVIPSLRHSGIAIRCVPTADCITD